MGSMSTSNRLNLSAMHAYRPSTHVLPFQKKQKAELNVQVNSHIQMCGDQPALKVDIGGAKYYISFIDNYTRRCTVQFMKHKDETSTKVQQYLTYIETHWDIKPKLLRADNGTEYVNRSLLTWCRDHGIETELTAPYSPSQNGVAKRFNRTLLELLRAMIIAQNIPKFLWPEVVTHATYIRNRSYTHANDDATPEGQWSNKRPNISHLHKLGSPVWILREGVELSKLDPKSTKQMFIGYLDSPKAIKYYDTRLCQVKVSRNYQFPKEYADSHTPAPIVQREGESDSTDVMMLLKQELQTLFEVTDMGEPSKIVGIEIEHDREHKMLKIAQKQYIESIL